MYIEYREDWEDKVYLVNEKSHKYKDAWCWTDCSQDGFKEYGNGNRMFLFEGMGCAYQPFAFDLIHADTKEEAEKMVQERYCIRFQLKTLVRKSKELIEVIDNR